MLILILNCAANSAVALLIGYVLDLIIGDPHGWWHPVQGIGWFITAFEKLLRRTVCKKRSEEATPECVEKSELTAGILLVILVLAVSVLIPTALLLIAYRIHFGAGFVLEVIMCYALLATKSLRTESIKVYTALRDQGLPEGRKAVSMIVGRDTENLTETGVVKAAVETVAENASDGVIAPMFYMAIGGPVLGFFYKAVNTMDSMVGYKNDKYMYLGRAAAKLDDVMNFIPSRLCAVFMIAVSGICGESRKDGARIFKRDRFNHASPNSAQTEAVMAGALQIQLAGDAWYFGQLHRKKTIGDDMRAVEPEDIVRANRLLYGTSVFGLIVFLAVKTVIIAAQR